MNLLRILIAKLIFTAVILLIVWAVFLRPSASPGPGPGPGPEPSGKLHVLVVEETSQRSKLPPAQVLALTSGDVRDYLNSHCEKENGASTWRIYDKDQDVSNESQDWQDEFAVLKKETPPTIAIKSGRRWTKPQPFPKDTEALLTLLKKYGGK
jgi:hypothetical protein